MRRGHGKNRALTEWELLVSDGGRQASLDGIEPTSLERHHPRPPPAAPARRPRLPTNATTQHPRPPPTAPAQHPRLLPATPARRPRPPPGITATARYQQRRSRRGLCTLCVVRWTKKCRLQLAKTVRRLLRALLSVLSCCCRSLRVQQGAQGVSHSATAALRLTAGDSGRIAMSRVRVLEKGDGTETASELSGSVVLTVSAELQHS